MVYWQDSTASHFSIFLNKGEWWPGSACLLRALGTANLHNHPSEEEWLCDFANKKTNREVNFHESMQLHMVGADLHLETQGEEAWIGAVGCQREAVR